MIFPQFAGLLEALEVQGKEENVSEFRASEGLWVFTDPMPFQSRSQTFWQSVDASINTGGGAGDYSTSVTPFETSGGILLGASVISSSIAGITGAAVMLDRTQDTDFPGVSRFPIYTIRNTFAQFEAASFVLVPDAGFSPLPIFCQRGTRIQLAMRMSGVGGTHTLRVTFAKTARPNMDVSPPVALGENRAPILVR